MREVKKRLDARGFEYRRGAKQRDPDRIIIRVPLRSECRDTYGVFVSRQFNYTKGTASMPFILPTLLSFQGSTHLFGVGSFSKLVILFFVYRVIFRRALIVEQ